MFTQRHFESVAKIIRDELDSATGRANRLIIRNLAQRFASEFESDNVRFDLQRFYAACGFNEEGNPPTSKGPVRK
jgi:hypothetical protein